MIEIIVWVILISFFFGAVLVVRYWYALFMDRDQYTRDEILNFYEIILAQLRELTAGKNEGANYIAIGAGIAVGWLLTYIGGAVSPDVGPEPDWASAQIPNYFFQSAFFIGVLHLAWPSFRELAIDSGNQILRTILRTEVPFFFGLSVNLAAVCVMVWGVHHETSFLYALINGLLCLFYAGIRFHKKAITDEPDEDSEYSPYQDDDEDYEDEPESDFNESGSYDPDDVSDMDFEEPVDIADSKDETDF